MYRIVIDYDRNQPIGGHWYGHHGGAVLPRIPNSSKRFYNLISLDPRNLPPDAGIHIGLERIYLPHYLNSDLTMEDIFFSFAGDRIVLLRDLQGAHLNIYDDWVDHSARNITFTKLRQEQNPASPDFDDEKLEYPHHQLAGTPYFKQPGGHILDCPGCGDAMVFIVQFDSDYCLEASFEDDGSAYYWWCDHCRVLGCRVESA
jgi:hypothetical protein